MDARSEPQFRWTSIGPVVQVPMNLFRIGYPLYIISRAHHVGTMVRRNKSDQKYSGAFVGEKVQPSISDIKGGGAPAPNLLPPNQNNQPRPYPVPNQVIQKPVEPPKPLIPIIPGKITLDR